MTLCGSLESLVESGRIADTVMDGREGWIYHGTRASQFLGSERWNQAVRGTIGVCKPSHSENTASQPWS